MFRLFLLALLASLALPAATLEELAKTFASPPPETRIMMRWWWFGPAVTQDELGRELRAMRDAGIGGVEIQPVYPLTLDDPHNGLRNLPFLSPEFLDSLRFAQIGGALVSNSKEFGEKVMNGVLSFAEGELALKVHDSQVHTEYY